MWHPYKISPSGMRFSGHGGDAGGSFQPSLAVHTDRKAKVSRRCLEYMRLPELSAVPATSSCLQLCHPHQQPRALPCTQEAVSGHLPPGGGSFCPFWSQAPGCCAVNPTVHRITHRSAPVDLSSSPGLSCGETTDKKGNEMREHCRALPAALSWEHLEAFLLHIPSTAAGRCIPLPFPTKPSS